jgi:hypothetical protein
LTEFNARFADAIFFELPSITARVLSFYGTAVSQ